MGEGGKGRERERERQPLEIDFSRVDGFAGVAISVCVVTLALCRRELLIKAKLVKEWQIGAAR